MAVELPDGWRPMQVGGAGLVGAVWVDYQPGGVLSYRELMTTLLVRRGWRVVPTVTHIWVDSAASRDGGRALWGIPKELARFSFGAGTFAAREDTGAIAHATMRRRVQLPGRWPVRFSVVQQLGGRAKVSPVRSTARVELAAATFTAEPGGPLAFLTGRRPLLAFALREFRMRFGG
jgi:hypothetical protein